MAHMFRALLLPLILLAPAATAQPATAPAAQPATAESRTDDLLAAMGGRNAWATVRALRVEAKHYEVRRPAPYDNRILIDFDAFRLAITASGPGIDRHRAMSGDRGRAIRDGAAAAMSAADVASDRAWWDAHIYRTMHRLARRDPALATSLDADGRLRIAEGGTPLMTISQNAAGEPVAFMTGATGTTTVFGPLVAFPDSGGVKVPAFSVRPDGSWRAILTAVTANPPLTAAVFEVR